MGLSLYEVQDSVTLSQLARFLVAALKELLIGSRGRKKVHATAASHDFGGLKGNGCLGGVVLAGHCLCRAPIPAHLGSPGKGRGGRGARAGARARARSVSHLFEADRVPSGPSAPSGGFGIR